MQLKISKNEVHASSFSYFPIWTIIPTVLTAWTIFHNLKKINPLPGFYRSRGYSRKVIPVLNKTAMHKTYPLDEDPEEQRGTPREYGDQSPVQNR